MSETQGRIIGLNTNLIEAIRTIRRVTGLGLVESKAIAEEFLKDNKAVGIVVEANCEFGKHIVTLSPWAANEKFHKWEED